MERIQIDRTFFSGTDDRIQGLDGTQGFLQFFNKGPSHDTGLCTITDTGP